MYKNGILLTIMMILGQNHNVMILKEQDLRFFFTRKSSGGPSTIIFFDVGKFYTSTS